VQEVKMKKSLKTTDKTADKAVRPVFNIVSVLAEQLYIRIV